MSQSQSSGSSSDENIAKTSPSRSGKGSPDEDPSSELLEKEKSVSENKSESPEEPRKSSPEEASSQSLEKEKSSSEDRSKSRKGTHESEISNILLEKDKKTSPEETSASPKSAQDSADSHISRSLGQDTHENESEARVSSNPEPSLQESKELPLDGNSRRGILSLQDLTSSDARGGPKLNPSTLADNQRIAQISPGEDDLPDLPSVPGILESVEESGQTQSSSSERRDNSDSNPESSTWSNSEPIPDSACSSGQVASGGAAEGWDRTPSGSPLISDPPTYASRSRSDSDRYSSPDIVDPPPQYVGPIADDAQVPLARRCDVPRPTARGRLQRGTEEVQALIRAIIELSRSDKISYALWCLACICVATALIVLIVLGIMYALNPPSPTTNGTTPYNITVVDCLDETNSVDGSGNCSQKF